MVNWIFWRRDQQNPQPQPQGPRTETYVIGGVKLKVSDNGTGMITLDTSEEPDATKRRSVRQALVDGLREGMVSYRFTTGQGNTRIMYGSELALPQQPDNKKPDLQPAAVFQMAYDMQEESPNWEKFQDYLERRGRYAREIPVPAARPAAVSAPKSADKPTRSETVIIGGHEVTISLRNKKPFSQDKLVVVTSSNQDVLDLLEDKLLTRFAHIGNIRNLIKVADHNLTRPGEYGFYADPFLGMGAIDQSNMLDFTTIVETCRQAAAKYTTAESVTKAVEELTKTRRLQAQWREEQQGAKRSDERRKATRKIAAAMELFCSRHGLQITDALREELQATIANAYAMQGWADRADKQDERER